MALTTLDGRAFAQLVAAGTYFLRKYRGVLDDLNVFPVPDGDTGSNMYLTSIAAALAMARVKDQPLCAVAAAAAQASLLGARGNSGVILSQMLRGFAQTVRERSSIRPEEVAAAMRAGVETARAALATPVEGTILSVAGAAAEAASANAASTPDLDAFAASILEAAHRALERTPEQLPMLKEAGVVDSGGAGFVYFLEGIVRFRAGDGQRVSQAPQPARRKRAYAASHRVTSHRFCTEFVLEGARIEAGELRAHLRTEGDSLIVAGERPSLKVHLHTDLPERVRTIAEDHGSVTRFKAEDMAAQHGALVGGGRRPAAAVAVVPGEGFARIAHDLGAEPLLAGDANPTVEQLLRSTSAAGADTVYLLCGDPNVVLAAREAARIAAERLVVIPTRDPAASIAALIALGPAPSPDLGAEELMRRIAHVGTASLFFAGKSSAIGGTSIALGAPAALVGGALRTAPSLAALAGEVAAELGADDGGLVTLYYGGSQRERDAQRLAAILGERFAGVTVEVAPGGSRACEYVIAVER